MDFIWPLLFIFGLVIMAAEAFIFTFGALAITGAVLFFVALTMLQASGIILGYIVTSNLVLALGCMGILILLTVIYYAAKAYSHRAKPLLEGEIVTIMEWENGAGKVRLKGGEIWNAISIREGLQPGHTARIIQIDNLTLTIG